MAVGHALWPPAGMNRHCLVGLVGLCAGIIAALVLCMLAVSTADAQSRYRQVQPSVLPPPGYAPANARRTSGPPWAMPNECYIDEGFGRFSPCG
jgi:hypothetical protein